MRGDILFGDPNTRSRYTLRGLGLRDPTNAQKELLYVLNFVSQDYEGNSWQLKADLTSTGFKIVDWMKFELSH